MPFAYHFRQYIHLYGKKTQRQKSRETVLLRSDIPVYHPPQKKCSFMLAKSRMYFAHCMGGMEGTAAGTEGELLVYDTCYIHHRCQGTMTPLSLMYLNSVTRMEQRRCVVGRGRGGEHMYLFPEISKSRVGQHSNIYLKSLR
jgi:hypothetical protein